MDKKTTPVLHLVQDVLRTFAEPYTEDVIEDVCLAIERDPDWRRRYDEIAEVLRPWVVNNWIGRYTKDLTRLRTVAEVDAKRGTLIKAYTKLVP